LIFIQRMYLMYYMVILFLIFLNIIAFFY